MTDGSEADDLSLMRRLAGVMGWEEWEEGAAGTNHYFVRGATVHRYNPAYGGWRPWRPLEDMGDAWMIVEKLCAFTDEYRPVPQFSLDYDVGYGVDRRSGWSVHVGYICEVQFEASPMRAIALAALAAVEATEG